VSAGAVVYALSKSQQNLDSLVAEVLQAWTGHCAMAQEPPFDEYRRPTSKNKTKI